MFFLTPLLVLKIRMHNDNLKLTLHKMKTITNNSFEVDINTISLNIPYMSSVNNFIKMLTNEARLFLFRISHLKGNKYRNYYYKRLLSKYNDIDSYSSIYENYTTNNFLKADVEICFSGLFKFNSNIKDIKKKLYYSNYRLLNNRFLNLEILSFKMLIGSRKVKCQMHFYEKKLFLYNYTFTNLKKHEESEIFNIVLKKYVCDIINYREQNIIDSFNNCIQINSDFQLSINYFSRDCDFSRKIASLLQEKENQRIRENMEYNTFAYLV